MIDVGIEVSGAMIVGESGRVLEPLDDYEDGINEWAEDAGLDRMYEHYDADPDRTYYGFIIEDVPVSDMQGEWMTDVQRKADAFKKLTGINARLIGTQNVY